ncbi:acyl-CoA dehydrogenase [Pseudooceanicola sediminis]|uniref:Acyl-CoA dehydrogenase n=1 Tax=Pseudooceanicola sediminis TaxID=2211117 RepID=A0A399J1Y2_9RHOB|nr:acyl-CoA dehydrogenase family protein [Pseudooceanicola sediminis]KAA2314701.1 acyl-CoA dehydrogenase [Puniceibacterium sp. HSS470]RII39345.1 acyl-CoA dehydrogenase [Pseudooceanicola sediminis]|tara:strand:- start:193621 stop:195246 length:1626 start_codon:yes stop_codon:yes gene_type:complete
MKDFATRRSADQQRRTLAALAATPGWAAVCAARDDIDDHVVAAILEAAGALTDEVLAPLDRVADQQGCRIGAGRVQVPQAYHAAFRAVAEGGWMGLDLPQDFGGSGLPITVQAAAGQIFDGGCPAFNMVTGASRAGAVLLAERAPADVAALWVPDLIAGRRSTTICISEPGAGSDVGRISTRAVQGEDGVWRVTGQKIWISFGDHDLTPVIGHCLLARTGEGAGTRGLSLFLVPSRREDGSENGVTALRLEEKMGLHGSPTCVMEFAGAEAVLLGEPERGLVQLFTMIELMRLQTGCQGLGAASRACDIAESYAEERLQGGAPTEPPVAIARHPDVRRQLGAMRGATEVLRVAVLEIACAMDLARQPAEDDAAALVAYLLPLIKAFGAETGFDVVNAGIQVLGGAGYTAEWPLEQMLRDSRVLAIYEGTTGMQGIDFLERQLIRNRAGFDAFIRRAGAGGEGDGAVVIARFAALADVLLSCPDADKRLMAADDWLRAGWLALTCWLAPRVASYDAPARDHAMAQMKARFAVHEAAVHAALA